MAEGRAAAALRPGRVAMDRARRVRRMVAPIDRWNRKRRGRTRPAPGLNVHGAQGAGFTEGGKRNHAIPPRLSGRQGAVFLFLDHGCRGRVGPQRGAHALAQHRQQQGGSHVELGQQHAAAGQPAGLRDSGVSTMRRPRPTTACRRWRRRCRCAIRCNSSRYIRLVSWMSRRSSVDLGIGHPLLRCVRGPDSWRARSKAWRVLGRASAQAGRRPAADMVCRSYLSDRGRQ